MTTDTTTDRISRRVDVSPGRATVVAAAVLFTDMLLHGLAIPVLPLLPAVLEQGSAATHDMPPAIPCAKRARRRSQYGPPAENSSVAPVRTTRPATSGILGPRRSTMRPANRVETIIATA